ncbi:hypothetical protein AQUCO_00400304v1, partial [Aquilegia coerulea]
MNRDLWDLPRNSSMKRESVITNTPFACLQIAAKELTLGKAKDKNFVFSPYSIQLALGLAANGAKGLTREEFLTFLNAETLDDLNPRNKDLIDYFNNGSNLSYISGIWVNQSSDLKPTFKQIAENIYEAKAESVDLQDEMKCKEVIDRVNEWGKEATNGLIKSFLPEDSLTPATIVVLANALYFKGRWLSKFNKPLTKENKFNLLNGRFIKVPFMTSYSDQYITTLEDSKILRLPLMNSASISMYIILPNKLDGLWPLLEKVASDPKFLERYVLKETGMVEVRRFGVPKFKITYDFVANEVLKALGLREAFSKQAGFDEIVLDSNNLKISTVRHKSHIEVNEEEIEAAAVTEIDFEEECSEYIPQVDFWADHPFMFMVRDDMRGVVLFMGHI